MRVTIGPRNRIATVVVSAAIVLGVLLLGVATVGSMVPDDADEAHTTSADAATQDTGIVNPWAAGDAAALRELAELGRPHLGPACMWTSEASTPSFSRMTSEPHQPQNPS